MFELRCSLCVEQWAHHSDTLKIQAYHCHCPEEQVQSVFHASSVLQNVPLHLHSHCRPETKYIKMAFLCVTWVGEYVSAYTVCMYVFKSESRLFLCLYFVPVTRKAISVRHIGGSIPKMFLKDRGVRKEKAHRRSYEQGCIGLFLAEVFLLALVR